QAPVIDYVRRGLLRLQIPTLGTVLVHAQQPAAAQPAWSQEFSLLETPARKPLSAETAQDPISPQPPDPSQRPGESPAAKIKSPVKTYTGASASHQPIVIRWSDFDPLKLGITLAIALYGGMWALDPSYSGWQGLLHLPNLAIHETGHLLFLPFGRFLTLLGGSLTQILFPAAFAVYFWWSRQLFSGAVTLFWTGQNFMDVALYMADAPYRALPLTVDNIDAHDWWNLFLMMGNLPQAGLIAGLTHGVGVVIYLVAIGGCLWFSRKDYGANRPV
ncbi:hypothetical protein C7271_25215, partial [filamentous cyanobacterium CCP5]